jgi:hypothetical protein
MPNYPPSGIKTAVYNFYALQASFTPPGGTYQANQNVDLTTLTPAPYTIWYTTDGSVPIPGVSMVYDPLSPILVDHNLTIKAIVGKDNCIPRSSWKPPISSISPCPMCQPCRFSHPAEYIPLRLM